MLELKARKWLSFSLTSRSAFCTQKWKSGLRRGPESRLKGNAGCEKRKWIVRNTLLRCLIVLLLNFSQWSTLDTCFRIDWILWHSW